MKTLIYFQDADTIKTSGIGRAMSHQLQSCKAAGVETTINKKDTYDLAHINTYWGKSQRLLKRLKNCFWSWKENWAAWSWKKIKRKILQAVFETD